MFKFHNMQFDTNQSMFSAYCKIDASHGFFKGHFDQQPLMPAAPQIQMLKALIESQKGHEISILGGRNIKFIQRVLPDELIKICCTLINATSIDFVLLKTDESVATKGTLIVTGVNH